MCPSLVSPDIPEQENSHSKPWWIQKTQSTQVCPQGFPVNLRKETSVKVMLRKCSVDAGLRDITAKIKSNPMPLSKADGRTEQIPLTELLNYSRKLHWSGRTK